MKVTSHTKIGFGLYLGLMGGLVAGAGRAALLLVSENYSWDEICRYALNLLQAGTIQFLPWGILVGALLGVLWVYFDRLDGFILSGMLVAVPYLPLFYFINKKFLPGFFTTVSLAANGFLLLAAFGAIIIVFIRWLKDIRFLSHLYSRGLLIVAIAILATVNLGYLLQDTEKKLQAASSTPADLASLLKQDILPEAGGDEAADKERLRRYFAGTNRKRLVMLPEKLSLKDSSTIVADAEKVVRREFSFLNITKTLPHEIDWRSNPTSDREWLLALNRQDWLIELALAYHLTGDSRYARTFDEIMRGWFKQNPMLRWKNESDNIWRLIETSARITDSWIEAFALFFDAKEVSDEVRWRMLASLHDHAQFLAHFRSPRRNHLLQETFGLVAVAAAFPEFKMSELWLEIARARLDFALRTDVYPDGGYTEGSTYYHRFAIRILQQIGDFAAKHEVGLSDFFHAQLEKMYEFLMFTARPDGVMPQMNDGFHAKNVRVLFEKPAEIYARPDFKSFAGNTEPGAYTEGASRSYPYSGIYVMRSDWRADGRYMIIDAGPFGSSHGHEDKLSFELFALGKPFIVESGTFTYQQNRWRRYFTSSFAHNTIVIDDRSQLRYPDEGKWVNAPADSLPNTWLSNEKFDYLEAKYADGYGNIKEDVLHGLSHTRRILFVKPHYWIVWDVVGPAGEHRVQQFWHLAPGTELTRAEEGAFTVSYAPGPHLYVKSFSPDGASIVEISGSVKPVQGWVSKKYGEKEPAPVLAITMSGSLPASIVTVFIPGARTDHMLEIMLRKVSSNKRVLPASSAVSLSINTSEFEDQVLLAPGIDGTKESGSLSTKEQLFINRTLSNGEFRQIRLEQVQPL